MKVIGITSSFKNSKLLLNKALEGAKSAGAEIEMINLTENRIDYCKGCMSCMRLGKCVLPDDLNFLRDRIRNADGIILASPTHALAPNALMKGFLDRIGMYNVYTGELSGKYMAGISTAGAFGAKNTAQKLADSFSGFFKSSPVSGVLAVPLGWETAENLLKSQEKALELGSKVVRDIRNKRKYPFQRIGNKILVALVLKRIISRNILVHKESEMLAVYEYHKKNGTPGF